jgi:hypothetical protein
MTAVCLVVLSIIGTWCYDNAAPIGDCYPLPTGTLCFVAAEELPIRASWYDPALGGINCMEPCDLLGDGTAVAEAYGWAASCPNGWYGRWLDVEYAGRWQCRDHGGAIVPTWGEAFVSGVGTGWHWWITVDFLAHEQPSWAYLLLDWQ